MSVIRVITMNCMLSMNLPHLDQTHRLLPCSTFPKPLKSHPPCVAGKGPIKGAHGIGGEAEAATMEEPAKSITKRCGEGCRSRALMIQGPRWQPKP